MRRLGWDASSASLARCVPTLVPALRRTSGPSRHFLASSARVRPDAPPVGVVRGCARAAAPSRGARRRPRARSALARGRPPRARRARSAGASTAASLALVARRLGARRLRRGGVGAPAAQPVRPAAGGRRLRVVPGRVQQPRRRLGGAVHARALGYAACPPLVAHAALGYPDGRVGGRLARAALALAYVGAVGVLGLLPRARLRPRGAGLQRLPATTCWLVTSAPGLVDAAGRAGMRARPRRGRALLAALALARIARASGRRAAADGARAAAGCAYLALVAAALRARRRARLPLQRRRRPRAVARRRRARSPLLALGVAWELGARPPRAHARRAAGHRARATRRPSAGCATRSRARSATPRSSSPTRSTTSRRVDAQGRPVRLDGAPGRAVTPLVRGGRPVAVLAAPPRAARRPGAARGRGRGRRARARPRAPAGARRGRSSSSCAPRARASSRPATPSAGGWSATSTTAPSSGWSALVRAAAAARGARRGTARRRSTPPTAELLGALAELRELARGIYPAVLADEGLAAALEALAETGQAPMVLEPLPDERFRPRSRRPRTSSSRRSRSAASAGSGAARRADGRLRRRDRRRRRARRLVELEDRVGALDGDARASTAADT